MPEIEKQSGELNKEQLEETIENPEETTPEGSEEQPEETTEEQETSQKPEKTTSEMEEANKKLYARMKKAEARAKELETKKPPVGDQSDSLALAKTIAALKEHSAQELDDIALIAKAKGLSLEEAAQTEESKVLVAARREKVAKEQKTPLPSSSLTANMSSKDIGKMDSEKHKALWEKAKEKNRRQVE